MQLRAKLVTTATALLLIAVVVITVARSPSGRGTDGPLVVSGGVPPTPPAAGVPPAAGPASRDAWGRAGRYRAWATRMSTLVPIAPRVLAAYALGEQSAPESCGLSWVTLAAIGSVESAHGSFKGAVVGDDGTSTPPIVGPALDGRPGVQAIPDTDGGVYDGDTRWDHAVGPMQFLPSTWRAYGVDADGDGTARPNDLDDAAATAAVYLCASTPTMRTGAGWWAAVTTYNRSGEYARNVLDRSNEYARASIR